MADIGFFFLSPTGAALSALKAGSDAAINSYWTAVRSLLKTTTQLAKIRIDEIDVNTGHVITGLDGAIPVPPDGTGATAQLPLQCATVVTLRTAFSGGSYRGRVYFPPMVAGALDANGYVTSGVQSTLASGIANYLHSVHTGGGDWESAVYSRKLHAMSPVFSVDVGSVVDTQRNRRSSLVESRVSASV